MKALKDLMVFAASYELADRVEKKLCKDIISAMFVQSAAMTVEEPKLVSSSPHKHYTKHKKGFGTHYFMCDVCGKKSIGTKMAKTCHRKECKRIKMSASVAKYTDKKNGYIIQPMANYIQEAINKRYKS